MTNTDMRNMPDHYPQRGDQVEAWIKDRRDERRTNFEPEAHDALDNLLDEYRLAADTGQSLERVVNGEPEEPQALGRKKKKAQIT